MSWPLFCHNYSVVNSDTNISPDAGSLVLTGNIPSLMEGAFVFPTAGTLLLTGKTPHLLQSPIVGIEDLYTGGTLWSGGTDTHKQMFAVGTNGKILINPRGHNTSTYIVTSTDDGDTWDISSATQVDSIRTIEYHEAGDAYFLTTSNSRLLRSTDEGANWTTMVDLAFGYGLCIDENDDVCVTIRASGAGYIRRYTDPITTTDVETVVVTGSYFAHDGRWISQLDGKYWMGNNTDDDDLTHNTLTFPGTSTLVTTGTDEGSIGQWWFAGGISSGYGLSFISSTTDTLTFFKVLTQDTVDITFSENVILGSVVYSQTEDVWVMVAKSTTTTTKLLVITSDDGVNWGPEVEITLAAAHDSLESQACQVAVADGKVYFAYIDSSNYYHFIKLHGVFYYSTVVTSPSAGSLSLSGLAPTVSVA